MYIRNVVRRISKLQKWERVGLFLFLPKPPEAEKTRMIDCTRFNDLGRWSTCRFVDFLPTIECMETPHWTLHTKYLLGNVSYFTVTVNVYPHFLNCTLLFRLKGFQAKTKHILLFIWHSEPDGPFFVLLSPLIVLQVNVSTRHSLEIASTSFLPT